MSRNMPTIIKKLLKTDTIMVSINILSVACFPAIVKNLNTITINPNELLVSLYFFKRLTFRAFFTTNSNILPNLFD